MNYSEVNKTTSKLLKQRNTVDMFSNSWEASGRLLSSLAMSKDALTIGHEDSFTNRSQLLPKLAENIKVEEMTLTDLIILSQAAKAIEDGDTKAATFVRDTAGGKPIEKKQELPHNNLHDLTDEQLAYLEANVEVIDE